MSDIQLVGALCRAEGELEITFAEPRLCKLEKDQRRIRQASICLLEIRERTLHIVLSQFYDGTFEIRLTKIRVEPDRFIQKGSDIRIWVLHKPGARQAHIGRAKVRIQTQSQLIRRDRTC